MTNNSPRSVGPLAMVLGDGEPEAKPWRVALLSELVCLLDEVSAHVRGRIRIIAIGGRSGSGKTTLAGRLAGAVSGASIVHTDDVAWWHSFFGWTELLVTGVLKPAWDGRAVSYRPPSWDSRGRAGAIEVPADASWLLVEGVGAARWEVGPWLDAAIWVQADLRVRARRDEWRVASGEVEAELVSEWMAAEFPFFTDERPWERADVIVAGTPTLSLDAETEVVLGCTPLISQRCRHGTHRSPSPDGNP